MEQQDNAPQVLTVMVDGQAIELRSMSHREHREFKKLEKDLKRVKARGDAARQRKDEKALEKSTVELEKVLDQIEDKKEAAAFRLYPDLAERLDDLPARDWTILVNATRDYSQGVPEATLKNFYGLGATGSTQANSGTAPNAG